MKNLRENKSEYESPSTKKTQVELEDGICTVGSAAIKNPQGNPGEIESHKVNQDFGGSFSNTEWDENN